MFKRLIIIAAMTAALSAPAQDELILTDWKTSGANDVVLDSSTGIEWLNLKHTHKKSMNTRSFGRTITGNIPTQKTIHC